MDTIVKQTKYPGFKDGDAGKVRLNRRGEIVTADIYQQWVFDGRCFITSNTAMETAELLGDTTFAEAVGAIAIDVPSGVTMIPLEIMLAQGGTVAGGDILVQLTADDKVRITSGVKGIVHNYLISSTESLAPMCESYIHKEGTTNLVIATPAEDNTFYGRLLKEELVAGDNQNVLWSARKYAPPIFKGPSSMVVHLSASAGAGVSMFFHVLWAEFRTTEMVP